MKSLTRSIIGASGLVFAGGCAILPNGQEPSVTPHASAHVGASAADGQYQLAKYYVGQQRHALALIAFTRAIEYDPNHAEARNGRATMLVEFGDLQAATQELRKALEISPKSVHLLNNLGYVQMLAGDLAGAATTLKRAFAIEPMNARVRANWALLTARLPSHNVTLLSQPLIQPGDSQGAQQERLGPQTFASAPETTRAPQNDKAVHSGSVVNLSYEPRVAPAFQDEAAVTSITVSPIQASSPGSEPNTVSAPAPGANADAEFSTAVINVRLPGEPTTARPNGGTTVVSAAVSEPSISTSPIRQGAISPFLTQRNNASTSTSTIARTKASVEPAPVSLRARIEIANGNGVRYAARTVGQQLSKRGAVIVRVSNAPTFDVERSTIYFRDGHLQPALALSRTLAIRPALMLGLEMPEGTDLKLVIGRDVSTQAELNSLVPRDRAMPKKVALLK